MLKSPEPPTPEKLTSDSVLALSLIHLKTSGNLTDIRPFNLDEELKALESYFKTYTMDLDGDGVYESAGSNDITLSRKGYHRGNSEILTL